MYYLVILFCGVLTHVCAPVTMPGQPFATEQECRQAGAANSNANKDNLGEYVCLKR